MLTLGWLVTSGDIIKQFTRSGPEGRKPARQKSEQESPRQIQFPSVDPFQDGWVELQS